MQDAENQSLSDEPQEPSAPAENGPPRLSKWNPVLFNDHGLRAGWRLLSFIVLVRFVLIPLSFMAVRPFRNALRSHLADISEALVLLCVLAGTFIMARVERRSLLDYGLRDRLAVRHFSSGLLTGFLSLSLMLLGLRAAHHFYFGPQHMRGSALLSATLGSVLAFLLVALMEETAFRGYPLFALSEGVGFWPAAVIMSMLFAWVHVTNPGESKIGIVAVFAFGMMLAFSLWRTGTLLWAIGFHFMWDYSETFIYGVPDSGFVSPEHLLSAKFVGPAWITGGSVGPEGSLFIFIVLAIVALLIHFAYPKPQFALQRSRDRAIRSTDQVFNSPDDPIAR